ncbi:hypothetical protein RCL_jg27456.t1 [Rhizophagus clarus]|nr:hypothetical protein RCL_jg27456.t1 [Rhizophagus clarus]
MCIFKRPGISAAHENLDLGWIRKLLDLGYMLFLDERVDFCLELGSISLGPGCGFLNKVPDLTTTHIIWDAYSTWEYLEFGLLNTDMERDAASWIIGRIGHGFLDNKTNTTMGRSNTTSWKVS